MCAAEPGVPLATKNISPFTITPTHGLDEVAGSDLVIASATTARGRRTTRPGVLEALREA